MPRFVRTLSQFSKSEIASLKKNARIVLRDAACTILASPQLGQKGRVLIILSKKVGSAPERNLLRRQLKSIYYEEKLYERKHDWIVIVKPAATALPFLYIKELLLKAAANLLLPS